MGAAGWGAVGGGADQIGPRLVELSPAFWRAALVERLAHESEGAASRDVAEALVLAKLALQVAERVGHSSAREYAYVCIANARRAQGDHAAADAADDLAKRLAVGAKEMSPFPYSRAPIGGNIPLFGYTV